MAPESTGRRGPKPRGGGESTRPVVFRATPGEIDAYKAAAKRAGLTMSEWIRVACSALLPARARRTLPDPTTNQED